MKIIKKIVVRLNLLNILSIPLYLCRIFRIQKNKIMFINFSGRGYGDNPKYIAEYILKEEKNQYDMVWAVKEVGEHNDIPNAIRQVKINSLKYFYELATSKVWINNSRFDLWIKKRRNQFYIHTWHASITIKKVEFDAYDKLSEYYQKVMKNDNKMIDLVTSNSEFNTEILFRKSFQYKGQIAKTGMPRDDILVNNHSKIVEKVKNYFNIPKEKKVVLYAPTFRMNYKDKNPYDINLKLLKEQLEKKCGEEYEIMVRLHPRVAKQSEKLIPNIKNYIDASQYSDMQELICACDILITDYSSTMCDAMLANKVVLIYANDIDEYKDERGNIFSFEELPFKLAKNNDELKELIKTNNLNDLTSEYKKFEDNKIKFYEMGHASESIVKVIENITANKK